MTKSSKPAAATLPSDSRVAPDCVLVIFGAGGDLTKRLLVPALYSLSRQRLLAPGFRIIGVDHNAQDGDGFRKDLCDFLESLAADPCSEFEAGRIDQRAWDRLSARIDYIAGDFEDPAAYRSIAEHLEDGDGAGGRSAIFYCATAPRFFAAIASRLARAGLAKAPARGFRRLVVEKPFGHDLRSAAELNRKLLEDWREAQVFRIDHFLGKETVQNILALRFANGVFEPLWSRAHIDHVQITAAETVDVADRGRFYEQTGALRDMVPNHLFQLLSTAAMEPPNSFDAAEVDAERAKVIEAIRREGPGQAGADSVRGQYRAGVVEGRRIADYRKAPEVDPASQVETYVALRLWIDNWRWAGVPFYVRTGKALGVRCTQVVVRFKPAPHLLFRRAAGRPEPNELALQIQPREGVSLSFKARSPGPELRLAPVEMAFRYADAFSARTGVGYETLLYDCMLGERTLFQDARTIELSWGAVQPFLDAWAAGEGELEAYRAGSDGPVAAAGLLKRDGRSWRPMG